MAQSLLTKCFGDEAVVLRIIFIIKTRAQRSVAGTCSSHLLRALLPRRRHPSPRAGQLSEQQQPPQPCPGRAASTQGLPSGLYYQQSSLVHRSPSCSNVLWAQLFCAHPAAAPISVCFSGEILQQISCRVPHLPCPPFSQGMTLNI